MESLLDPLLPLYHRERAAGRAVVLGVLVHTAGSTYRKPGALILIAADGAYAGMLSGGCVEGDLGQHAREVFSSGNPRLVTYDTRGGEDLLWGLGLGCEGAMRILLLRVGPLESWQPLSHLIEHFGQYRRSAVGIVLSSGRPDLPQGTLLLAGEALAPQGKALEEAARQALMSATPALALAQASGSPAWYCSDRTAAPPAEAQSDAAAEALVTATDAPSWMVAAAPNWSLFALPLTLPPQLLLLGAGPDAAPLVDLAARLNWQVTLADHRPAYADAKHFPQARKVLLCAPDELFQRIDPSVLAAVVVMSHHFETDLRYLQAVVGTGIAYVGLLGPASRRERLLAALGPASARLRERLHAPVGLALGGRSPEEVALAIVAEIQSFLHGPQAAARMRSVNE